VLSAEAARQEAAAARAREAQQEAEQRRAKAARQDALSGYNTLLAELVRDYEADYVLWEPKLKKDAQVG
jgi:very-short-patch-repair endonuclease